MTVSISIVLSVDRHLTSIKIGFVFIHNHGPHPRLSLIPSIKVTPKTASHFQFIKDVPLYLHLMIEYSQ